MYPAKQSNMNRHIRRRRRTGRLCGRTRFRALGRMVMNHRPWLTERPNVGKGVDEDIKKNVLRIDVMTKEKYQSLSIQNKSLLRKDQRLRTEEEIDDLHKVIGNLKCFRRYPENVRRELVASTYFEYYGGGRVIVRQDHDATFLGFVLRGELEVTTARVDPVFGNVVTEVTGQLGPGAVFGEVSLLHNVPRTNTVTSVSKGMGKHGSAHFVLSGTCSMVQRLMVSKDGEKYKLHPPDTAGPGVGPLVMQVCLFTQGGCFNLGESLAERTIVADTNVRVLRIPLYLLRQHNVANIWSRIRQFLESRMSSDQELFQKFLEARRWDKYKKERCAQLRNPNTLNHTTIHDAPYYWRVMGSELCNGRPCGSS
ncbi:uncharacterized protein LOC128991092 isoform X3 [Macrosteles quadrilineatus]|uniref:uncharacterized protein LOC128991092 isoform X3 n=1 Tax=Macrosteles quadrilineatus TaxID=74068 RepID=UPI0023E0CA3E|nr:uncharacterized protein LOC128991092 isoform X3 [Macrosteles quadrilineatus]